MEIKNHLDIKGHVKPGTFTTEELSKVTAEAGAIAYNSTVKELQVFDGTTWEALASKQESAPSSNLIDEDDMSSDSSSHAPTQQSVKAYSDVIKTDVTNLTTEVDNTKTNITSIQGDVTTLQSDLTTVEGQVTNINSDLTVVKKDIVSLGGEIVLVKDNINNIEGDITTLYTDVTTVEGNLVDLQTDVTAIENEVTNVKSSISTISTNISSIQTEVQSTSSKLVNENDFSSNSPELIPSQASVKSYVDSKTFDLIDEDDLSSNKEDAAPSQQSVKTYVDNIHTTIKSDITDINTSQAFLEGDLTTFKSNVNTLKSDLETEIQTVKTLTDSVKTSVEDVKTQADNQALEVADENDFSSNSTTKVPSQASVKAYVDAVDAKTFDLVDEDDLVSNREDAAPSQQSVKSYVDAVDTKVTTVKTYADTIKGSVDTIEAEVTAAKTELATVKSEVNAAPPLVDEDDFSSNSETSVPSQASVKAYVDSIKSTLEAKDIELLDEDDFATNSDTKGATQQSIKEYVRRKNSNTVYIDYANGDDTKDGKTTGTAWKTWDNIKDGFKGHIVCVNEGAPSRQKLIYKNVDITIDDSGLPEFQYYDFELTNSTIKFIKCPNSHIGSFWALNSHIEVWDNLIIAFQVNLISSTLLVFDCKLEHYNAITGYPYPPDFIINLYRSRLEYTKDAICHFDGKESVFAGYFNLNASTLVLPKTPSTYITEDSGKSGPLEVHLRAKIGSYIEGPERTTKLIEEFETIDFGPLTKVIGWTDEEAYSFESINNKEKAYESYYIDPASGNNNNSGKKPDQAFKDFTPIQDGSRAHIKFVGGASSLSDKTFTNCDLVIDHSGISKCFIWTLKFVNSKATLIGSQYPSPFNSDLFVSRLQQDNSEITIEEELHINDHVRLENGSKLIIHTGRLKFRGSPVGVGQPALIQLTDSSMVLEKTAEMYYCGHTPETEGSGITGYEHHFELNNSDLEFKSKELVNIQVKNGYPSVSAIKMTNGSSLKMFPRDIKFEDEWLTFQVESNSRIFGYTDYPNGFKVDSQYSYTETKTDKLWIDNKVIYRQAITGNLVNNDSVTVLSGVSDIVNFSLFAGFNGGAAHYALPYNDNNGSINVFRESDGSVKVSCDRSDFASGVSLRGIVEYTKTS